EAILEHRTAVTEDQRRRQAAVEILARDDLVAALFGKEVEPFVELCHIDQGAVFGEEGVDGGVIDHHRTAPWGSIPRTSAEYDQKPRNGTSVTRWSRCEVTPAPARSIAVVGCGRGFEARWASSIAAGSAIETGPA